MTEIWARFDFILLDNHTRQLVQQRTEEIKGLVKNIAQETIRIGGQLMEVKTLLPHGLFGEWLRFEFDWSADTAERFMNVARWAFKNPQFADFGFGPSALYLLAKPSTPEAARQEAIERAEAGEIISHALALAIIAAHKENQTENFSILSQPTASRPIPPHPETADSAPSSFGAWIDRIYNDALTFQNQGRASELVAPLTAAQRQKLSAIIEFMQSVAFFSEIATRNREDFVRGVVRSLQEDDH
ncbi:DUF3102 domain-containing protein [Candidatus Poribacteria bacterium]|nr:DUF3102 domain-containing protein [Candidatus Poribacteria bacterium]